MAYITDAAKNIVYKKKYAEYLKIMKEIAKIIKEYDYNFKLAEQKIDALNFELRRNFSYAIDTIAGKLFLHHEYDINDPHIMLSYEDFVDKLEVYNKLHSDKTFRLFEQFED